MSLRELWQTLRERLVSPSASFRLGAFFGNDRAVSIGGMGARRLPVRYVAGFAVLFCLFLALHLVALRLPSLLRAQMARLPGITCVFSDARLDFMPPRLTLTDVILGGPALGNERLRADVASCTLSFWSLMRGRLGGEFELTVGKGRLTLDVERPLWGETSDTDLVLDVDRLPLTLFSAVSRFDVRAEGTVTAQGQATIQWQKSPSGQLLPRGCTGDIRGAVRLVSLRNGLQGLLMDRFTDAVLQFGGSMAGRVFTLSELRFTAQQMDVSVTGKAVADWRAPRQSELNLVAEMKTEPENVSPQLLPEALRQRLAQGQSLAVAIQGTLFVPVLAPIQ